MRLEKRHNHACREYVYFASKQKQNNNHLKYMLDKCDLWNNEKKPEHKTLSLSKITSFPNHIMNAYKFKHADKILTYKQKCQAVEDDIKDKQTFACIHKECETAE